MLTELHPKPRSDGGCLAISAPDFFDIPPSSFVIPLTLRDFPAFAFSRGPRQNHGPSKRMYALLRLELGNISECEGFVPPARGAALGP